MLRKSVMPAKHVDILGLGDPVSIDGAMRFKNMVKPA